MIIDESLEAAKRAGFRIREVVELSAKDPQYEKIPAGLNSKIRELLGRHFPRGLYVHQSRAIQWALDEKNVCIATSTASGKSLVFMAVAADRLLSDPRARVIAMYPAKALIQDQRLKWKDLLEPLGLTIGYIDGSVPLKEREGILQRCRLLLMTPDVAQAWLMRSLSEKSVSSFLANLKLLILDEGHVYDGVFGTNMAYFLRRSRWLPRATK